ncbi:hypothetical protein WR25_09006 [Diploscapter pachys]|uniref:Uncharacterized protein n=1 Tax=Diploscapter pachys TaxID=2018661 RepID=A0A2A2M1A7_9BILA|nr:hypothetical protein WR25_09006 [Diploscapter pachys]
MGKAPKIEAEFARLTVRIELDSAIEFEQKDFELFVQEAVRQIYGTAGPSFKVCDFDPTSRKGSLVGRGDQVLKLWSALSISGLFLNNKRIAAHFNSGKMAHLIFLVLIPVVLLFIFIAFLLTIFFSIPSKRPMFFYKKHAVITGGSKGIGYQLAIGLLDRGCNVTIIARNKEDLKKACDELQAHAEDLGQDQKVHWISADLAGTYEDVEKAIKEAEEKLGPVDILINNAGHSVQVFIFIFRFAEIPKMLLE